MNQKIYLLHLNRFFHCMAGAIIENGGEVLRFIGDAVLAIFPIVGGTSKSWENATGALEACRRAIKTTENISERIEVVNIEHGDLPPLKYSIGCIWVTSLMATSASLSG
jgi:adenylate cyclase